MGFKQRFNFGQCVKKCGIFFAAVFISVFFANALWDGRFVYHQAVRHGRRGDSSSQRQSSYAYVDGDYRGFSDGCDGDDRPLCRSAQFSQSGARDRQYGDVICGAFTGFGRRAAFEQSSYSRFDCDSDGGG